MSDQATPQHTYRVFVDDNYHYVDETERYELGEFGSCERAVAACKRIVDEFMLTCDLENPTPDHLWAQYTSFGEDPFIATTDPNCKFSAWDYARQRCAEILTKESEHQ